MAREVEEVHIDLGDEFWYLTPNTLEKPNRFGWIDKDPITSMDLLREVVRSDAMPKDLPGFEEDFLFTAFDSAHQKSYLVEIYSTYYKDGEDFSHIEDLETAMKTGQLVPFLKKWMIDKGYSRANPRWVRWLHDHEFTLVEASKVAMQHRRHPACYLCTKRDANLQQCSKCKTAKYCSSAHQKSSTVASAPRDVSRVATEDVSTLLLRFAEEKADPLKSFARLCLTPTVSDKTPSSHFHQWYQMRSLKIVQQILSRSLLERVPEFRWLTELREQGWKNPQGDSFFAQQRATADRPSPKTERFFYEMMQNLGRQLQASTGAFNITASGDKQPHVLDMCMAPGGFLSVALECNPLAHASAFTLPSAMGGHSVLLPQQVNVTVKEMDITLLASDMGREAIPDEHPDAANFLPKQFTDGRIFELAICDGQVLRTHERSAHRANGEARRLTCAQYALSLEHLVNGGTMIILLHKVEAPHALEVLYQFHQFSKIDLYKHPKVHTKRSSYYLIARNVQVAHPAAISAVESWKQTWEAATFGTMETYLALNRRDSAWAEIVLKDFGEVVADLGRPIWRTQAEALAKAPFIRRT